MSMRILGKKQKLSYLIPLYIFIYLSTINYWRIIKGENSIERSLFLFVIVLGLVFEIARLLRLKKISSTEGLFFVYMLYCLFSYMLSSYSDLSSAYAYVVLPSLLLGYYYFHRKLNTEYVIIIFIVCSIFVSLLTIYEFVFNQYVLITPTSQYGAFRPKAYADSPLSLGSQLSVSVILCYTMYKKNNRKRFLLCAVLTFIALLFTQSRGPLVGCLIGLYVFYILNMRRLGKGNNKGIIGLIIGIGFILVFLLLVSSGAVSIQSNNVILNRLISITNWGTDAGNLGRLKKWGLYLRFFSESPILGKGIGFVTNSGNGVAESGVIQQLAETGVIGTVLYYLVVYKVLKKGTFVLKNKDTSKSITGIGLISACISIIIYNTVFQIFSSTIGGTVFWILLSIIMVEYDKSIYH